MKFLTNIDLSKNELQNARLQNLGTAPEVASVANQGLVHFDSTNKVPLVSNGTAWVDMSKQGTVTGVTATLPVVSSGGTAPVISITEDSTHKFVTDAQIASWTGKQAPATTLAGYGITDASTTTAINTALGLKANSASPTFTGTVTSPAFTGALTGTASNASNLNNKADSSFAQLANSNAFTAPISLSYTGAVGSGHALSFPFNGVEGGRMWTENSSDKAFVIKTTNTTAFNKIIIDTGSLVYRNNSGTDYPIYSSYNLRLDNVPTPTANVDMGGFQITGLGDPSLAQDAVTKAYADSLRAGLAVKDSVRLASYNTNVVIATGGLIAVDGITTVAGNRVLLKNQNTPAENGIYIANTGAWTRSTDANSSSNVVGGLAVWVNEGNSNSDSRWVLSNNDPILLGVHSLTFVKDFQASDIDPGAGLTKTTNTLNVVGTANRITANADSIDIASTYVGQGTINTLGTIGTGIWQGTDVGVAYGGTGASDASTARTNLGIGTIATQASTAVSITGGSVTGITDITVADGGTGVSTLSGYARGSGTTAFTGVPVIPAGDGGTGNASYAVGDMLYATSATYLSRLADVALGNVLLSGGVGVAPVYGKLRLGDCVSGTLLVANGGTGNATGIATNVSGTVAVANGGTGNATGVAANVSGVVALANGGTGNSAGTPIGARSGIGATGKYTGVVPSGATSAVITHGLNSTDVVVAVYEANAVVYCEVVTTSATVVTLSFAVAPTASQYRCVVIG